MVALILGHMYEDAGGPAPPLLHAEAAVTYAPAQQTPPLPVHYHFLGTFPIAVPQARIAELATSPIAAVLDVRFNPPRKL